MATGPFGKYVGLHLGSGKKLHMDKTMNDGTLVLNDYRDEKGAPQVAIGAAIPNGSTLKSFVPGAAASVLTASGAIRRAAGIELNGSGYIDLGASARLAPGMYDWVAILWLKSTGFGSNSSNNRLLYLTNGSGGTTTTASVSITVSGGVVTTAQFSYSGMSDNTLPESVRLALTDGNLHQYAFSIESSSDGTLQRARTYLDGALVRTTPYYTKIELSANTVGDVATIGRSGYSNAIGTFCRARIDNVATAGISAAEIVANDYVWQPRLAA